MLKIPKDRFLKRQLLSIIFTVVDGIYGSYHDVPFYCRFCAKEITMREWNTKSLQLRRESISLQAGDSVFLRGARGLRLEATTSPVPGESLPLLWLTEEGELDDVFLRPGDCHVLRGNGRMVATAWGPISLRVLTSARIATPATAPTTSLSAPIRALPAQRSGGSAEMHRPGTAHLPSACCGA
jgi:Protein of unknown function (DUF2917)